MRPCRFRQLEDRATPELLRDAAPPSSTTRGTALPRSTLGPAAWPLDLPTSDTRDPPRGALPILPVYKGLPPNLRTGSSFLPQLAVADSGSGSVATALVPLVPSPVPFSALFKRRIDGSEKLFGPLWPYRRGRSVTFSQRSKRHRSSLPDTSFIEFLVSKALDQDRLHTLADHVGAVSREVRLVDYHTKRGIDALEIELVAKKVLNRYIRFSDPSRTSEHQHPGNELSARRPVLSAQVR